MSSTEPPITPAAHGDTGIAQGPARRPGLRAAPDAPGTRRQLNEASHKLGYWPGAAVTSPEEPAAPASAAPPPPAGAEDHGDVVAHASRIVLALGALGIVYGDIGTSPLYTISTIFSEHRQAAQVTPAGVYGVVSLIFWSLMIVVSLKYAGFIMRAHNRGDGGIMALTALVKQRKVPHTLLLITLGIFGAGLFFGDGMITPAISVISAVEGLKVADPSLGHLVVPIALSILIVLFCVQRFGTGTVGWLFGPVILIFFAVITALGLREVVAHPGVLQGLSPTWGVRFMLDHGGKAFLALGSVVLCVTGAEALYADRGHFGAGPIRLTWYLIVLPAVTVSYLGQAALVLAHPSTVTNPFFLLVPHSLLIPMVILATLATIIASQAAITGSYSVARQAVQLGFLPRLSIRHTSKLEGQIYVPVINWMLATGVVALVLAFQRSARLTEIYGVAVTGTFVLNTLLFLAVARSLWRTPRVRLAVVGGLFLVVELSFFGANLAKISHGAWLPLVVGLLYAFVMVTWRRGAEIVTANRVEEEGPLSEFLESLCHADPPIHRVPGTAIFLNPNTQTTPLALRAEVERIKTLHEKVLIVSIERASIPRVDRHKAIAVERLGRGLFKVFHVNIKVGYSDTVDVPGALALARKQGLLERNLDLEHASYLVSRMMISPTPAPGLARWRKRLFVALARNAASPIEQFRLPTARTVVVGSQVAI